MLSRRETPWEAPDFSPGSRHLQRRCIMNHMEQEKIDINKLPGVKRVIDLSKLEPLRIPFFLRLRPVAKDGGDSRFEVERVFDSKVVFSYIAREILSKSLNEKTISEIALSTFDLNYDLEKILSRSKRKDIVGGYKHLRKMTYVYSFSQAIENLSKEELVERISNLRDGVVVQGIKYELSQGKNKVLLGNTNVGASVVLREDYKGRISKVKGGMVLENRLRQVLYEMRDRLMNRGISKGSYARTFYVRTLTNNVNASFFVSSEPPMFFPDNYSPPDGSPVIGFFFNFSLDTRTSPDFIPDFSGMGLSRPKVLYPIVEFGKGFSGNVFLRVSKVHVENLKKPSDKDKKEGFVLYASGYVEMVPVFASSRAKLGCYLQSSLLDESNKQKTIFLSLSGDSPHYLPLNAEESEVIPITAVLSKNQKKKGVDLKTFLYHWVRFFRLAEGLPQEDLSLSLKKILEKPALEVLEHFFRDEGDICVSGRRVSFLSSVMLERTPNPPETTKEQAKHSITSFLEKNSVAPSEAFLEVSSKLVEEVLYPFFENDLYEEPRFEPYQVYRRRVEIGRYEEGKSEIRSDFTFFLDGEDGEPAEVLIYVGSQSYRLYPDIRIKFGFLL